MSEEQSWIIRQLSLSNRSLQELYTNTSLMFIDDYAFRELPRPRFAELERTLSSCTSAAIEVNAVAIVGSDGLLP